MKRALVTVLRRVCLRIALGDDYRYAVNSLNGDNRIFNAHTVDIQVRQDGVERYVEADWLKRLARLVQGCQTQSPRWSKPSAGPIGKDIN